MVTSNDLPLAARPIDRAAHRRTDADWLEAARASKDVLVVLMQSGEPLLEGEGPVPGFGQRHHGPPRPLFWLGPEGFRLGHQAELFLGVDTSGAPIFALDMPGDWDLAASPLQGLAAFEDMRGAAGVLSALEANLAATARSLFEWHRHRVRARPVFGVARLAYAFPARLDAVAGCAAGCAKPIAA
ncbi:MAG: NUDIX-like domain-containing protein, partial [Pseudomonadota bacterium]